MENGLVGGRTHEDEVPQIHLADSIHPHGSVPASGILEGDGRTDLGSGQLGYPLGDDHPVAREVQGFVARAGVQVDEVVQVADRGRRKHRDGLLVGVVACCLAHFLVTDVHGPVHVGPVQPLPDGGLLVGGGLAALGGNQVVANHLAELVLVDGRYGPLYAEPGHQKGHGAADPEDGHQHPLLVAEYVPCGDLVGEIEPIPNQRNMFEENLRSGAGRFGQEEGGGLLAQLPPGTQEGRDHGTQEGQQAGQEGDWQVEAVVDGWHVEGRGICLVDNPRHEGVAGDDADDGTQGRGHPAVDQELGHDIAVPITQGLQCSCVDSLLIHEAGHGCEGDQGGHQVHEVGEDLGQGIHDEGDGDVDLVAL